MVVTLVAVAMMSGYAAAFKSIGLAKSKMVAVSLANEKMETVRNKPYDDLGTTSGHPSGDILDDETINRNGTVFNVHTVISYVDDPSDGNVAGTIPGKPTDIYPYDYKKVEITVGRSGKNSQLAKLVTNVSAKAAETPSDTGILSLCVIDSSGQPVAEANVTITNTTLTPPFNASVNTALDGCVMVPKLPPDEHNNYNLSVTKVGYSISQTYSRTDQNPHALIPDENIYVQKVTSITLVIDRLSVLELSFVDQTNQPVPNVSFTLESSKMIYNNPDTYKFSQSYTADNNGYIKINDLEFDDYKLLNVSPMFVVSVSGAQPIHLSAGASLSVKATLSSSSTNPSIYNYSPMSGISGDNISILVNGDDFNSGATIKLVNPGNGAEIAGTNVDVQSGNKIVADFNLSGASPGLWNIHISNPDGESVTQDNAFKIVE